MDIYICNKFHGAREVAEQLKNTGIAENVYFVENIDYDSIGGIRKQISILSGLVFPGSTIKHYVAGKIELSEKKYEYIVSSGYLNFNIIFNTYFKKKNQNLKIIFLDDGMESYLEKNTKDIYSAIYTTVSRMLKIGGAVMDVEKLFVYAPQLVKNPKRYESIEVLPSLSEGTKEFFELMNYIFKFDVKKVGQKTRVIYFDQLSNGDFNNEEYIELQKEILDIFGRHCDMSEWSIKMHPRARLDLYDKKCQKLTSRIPWELFCQQYVDDDSVLIAISSTACFTPKIIYDMEPTVILLEKLFDNDTNRGVSGYFESVRGIYKDKSKVFIPESIEELQEIVHEIQL